MKQVYGYLIAAAVGVLLFLGFSQRSHSLWQQEKDRILGFAAAQVHQAALGPTHRADSLTAVASKEHSRAQHLATSYQSALDSLQIVRDTLQHPVCQVDRTWVNLADAALSLVAKADSAQRHETSAYQAQEQASANLRESGKLLSSALDSTTHTLQTQPGACRFPVIRVPCPTVELGYGFVLDQGHVYSGPTLSVAWTIWGGE